MEDKLNKFLQAQRAKAEADEKSNAVLKAAIEEILTPEVVEPEPVPEPIPEPAPEPEPVPEPEEPPIEEEQGLKGPVLIVEAGEDNIITSWDKVEGAIAYGYYRKDGTQGGWDFKNDLDGDTFRFEDTGLEPNTLYTVLVQARGASGERKIVITIR